MHHFGFLPQPANRKRAILGLERWHEAADRADDPEVSRFARMLAEDADGFRLLEALFGNSPFLTQCAVREPGFLERIVTQGPDATLAEVMRGLAELHRDVPESKALAPVLRIAKRRIALAVAVADIARLWPLEKVCGALSDFADLALGCASASLLKEAAATGAFALADPDAPERGSGLVILGMGKLGARELNYSSDIDLIVLYDPERIVSERPSELQNQFVRLTRKLVALIEERTADGYVFRTDLRLRPDPGSTPLALSVLAAETYYESLGQNWERAAMIKARPVAGDIQAGVRFLETLRPFVWRKHLDFAAIQDIHSIKRQITAARGGGGVTVAGHNIKVGRGGIREIEFFVQTQQLIWGGRRPALRSIGTIVGLRALAAAGLVAPAVADEMIADYRFLRRVEHFLQMINDEQTQRLPEGAQELADLAVFLGYDKPADFVAEMLTTLRRVESHYARLFEDAPSLGAEGTAAGNLVFTGADPDPDTFQTLQALGYQNPHTVDAAVRGWHHGRYRAMRSTRARELLTELMPKLLAALANTPSPDETFLRFDRFLAGLPAGVQLFSMFYSKPELLDLVAEVIGIAPRLAEHLGRNPSVLESVLTPDFFEPPPAAAVLGEELERQLEQAKDFEDVLVICRRWANDRRFQVGVQSLRNRLTPRESAAALSNIADVALGTLLPRVEEQFARRHGRIADTGILLVALGKLGGREMTPSSDLDLILLYDAPADAGESDGAHPLPPTQYFARLSQRLINAVTAQTAEGRLYEIDMRLRPSGAAGPIATSLQAFVQYHEASAWTWEHMALTRARVIAGPPDLQDRAIDFIADVLTRPRDRQALLRDVAEMRVRMDAEHHTDAIWDVKYRRGGLVDVEFVAQYLELRHAHRHSEVLSPSTRTALERLRDVGALAPEVAGDLIEAFDLWQAIQQLLRLTVAGQVRNLGEDDIPRGLREALAAACGAVDYVALTAKMRSVAQRTLGHFDRIVAGPAAALARDDHEESPDK